MSRALPPRTHPIAPRLIAPDADLTHTVAPVVFVTEARGREIHTNSIRLMRRLNFLGATGIPLLAASIDGKQVTPESLAALNAYLRLHGGLNTFRRVVRTALTTRYGWSQFIEHLGLETLPI